MTGKCCLQVVFLVDMVTGCYYGDHYMWCSQLYCSIPSLREACCATCRPPTSELYLLLFSLYGRPRHRNVIEKKTVNVSQDMSNLFAYFSSRGHRLIVQADGSVICRQWVDIMLLSFVDVYPPCLQSYLLRRVAV